MSLFKGETLVAGIGFPDIIVDNLTTADSTRALSANQGKVLNDKFSRNYGFYKWPAGVVINSTTPVVSTTINITTKGRPVFLMVSGDNNPTTETAWFSISFYRGGTELCRQLDESHGTSWNIPFALSYLDAVAAGTYTYECRISRGAGDTNLAENGAVNSPQFVVFEI